VRVLGDMAQLSRGVTTWERVRWPDDEPLPAPGGEIAITRLRDGHEVPQTFLVVEVRPDFEPGWVQVEVKPA
jgi:hypothetical protein